MRKTSKPVIVLAAGAGIALILVGVARSCEPGGTETFKGGNAAYWYHRAVLQRTRALDLQDRLTYRVRERNTLSREIRKFRRTLDGGRSLYAIRLAAAAFYVPYSEMVAISSCETGGTFDPFARNPSSTASGLFQFLDSTWRNQGMSEFSVYDPIANALSAARVRVHDGSWRQWSCQP